MFLVFALTVKVKECLTNNGGGNAHAQCTNNAGSIKCECKTGFSGDGVVCFGKLNKKTSVTILLENVGSVSRLVQLWPSSQKQTTLHLLLGRDVRVLASDQTQGGHTGQPIWPFGDDKLAICPPDYVRQWRIWQRHPYDLVASARPQ